MLSKIPLGTTEMMITRVGLGAWAIGGGGWAYGWGDQDDEDSISAIRHAVESGINWIDTAAVYGIGHSEEVVRQALSAIPEIDRPHVFTKCGLVSVAGETEARRVGDPKSIKRECDESLRRLDVERIDLYQMHWPAYDVAVEDYWGALLDLKDEGKVRAVGLSNHGVDQLESAEKLGHVETMQPSFSAIKRDAATEVIPWCVDHDTGVIVYSPMQAGLLTGSFSRDRAAALPEGDWRSRDADFTGGALDRNLALADSLKPIAERHGVNQATIAVAWTLAWPGVSGAIVGARTPEQVEGWVTAASLALTEDDLREIADAIETTSAGSGPSRP